jgi:hypothetical protein
MTVTATPVFTQGVAVALARCTAAKTTYGDTTNAQLLFTAGPNGAVIYGCSALPAGAVALTQIQFFHDDLTNVRVLALGVTPAYTLATTTAPTAVAFQFTESAPQRITAGTKVWAGTAVANAAGIDFALQYENL